MKLPQSDSLTNDGPRFLLLCYSVRMRECVSLMEKTADTSVPKDWNSPKGNEQHPSGLRLYSHKSLPQGRKRLGLVDTSTKWSPEDVLSLESWDELTKKQNLCIKGSQRSAGIGFSQALKSVCESIKYSLLSSQWKEAKGKHIVFNMFFFHSAVSG